MPRRPRWTPPSSALTRGRAGRPRSRELALCRQRLVRMPRCPIPPLLRDHPLAGRCAGERTTGKCRGSMPASRRQGGTFGIVPSNAAVSACRSWCVTAPGVCHQLDTPGGSHVTTTHTAPDATATTVPDRPMLINGQWVAALDGEWSEVLSPGRRGIILARVPVGRPADADRAVAAAGAPFLRGGRCISRTGRRHCSALPTRSRSTPRNWHC